MVETRETHMRILLIVIIVAALLMPVGIRAPSSSGEEQEMKKINLYLKHDNTNYYMNSVKENPGNDNGVTDISWTYGWLVSGDVRDTDIKETLTIVGTYQTSQPGDTVIVQVRVANNNLISQAHVTMELMDGDDVIATSGEQTIDTFSSKDTWNLVFENSKTSHTFEKGSTMKIQMTSDNNVNIDYMNGEAHLEFMAQPMFDEESHVFFADNNGVERDMEGEYFMPKLPGNLGKAHIWGMVSDAFTSRDIQDIKISILAPDGDKPVENESADLHNISSVTMRFDYNWSYTDDMVNENDAGTYTIYINITDNNNNVFSYRDSLKMSKYGVYIEAASGESLSKQASAGDYVLYHFNVYNAGLVDGDTIEIAHDELGGGWTASFDKESVTLDAGDSVGVTMNVSIPASAEIGSFQTIVVSITSQKSSDDAQYPQAEDRITTTTRVSPTADISVFFKEEDESTDGSMVNGPHYKDGKAEKAKNKDFLLHVRNDSPYMDTITLTVKNTPPDWTVSLIDPESEESVNNVTLEGTEEAIIYVRVKPASAQGAADVAYLEITGTSSNNESVYETAYLNVTRTLGVVIELSEMEKSKLLSLKPGMSNTIEIQVINTGESDRSFTLEKDVAEIPEGWSVSLSEDTVSVPKGGTAYVDVYIIPVDNAIRSNVPYTLKLTATATNDNTVRYEGIFDMNVKIIYGVTVVIEKREKTVKSAGESVEYLVRVKNTGNSEVTITLSISKSKKEWDAELDRTTDTFSPGAEKEFHLTVTAPDPVDNKEECKVTVTAMVVGHEATTSSQMTKTKVDKDFGPALLDAISSNMAWVALGFAAILIGMVAYFRTRQYEYEEEEDEEYEEEIWE